MIESGAGVWEQSVRKKDLRVYRGLAEEAGVTVKVIASGPDTVTRSRSVDFHNGPQIGVNIELDESLDYVTFEAQQAGKKLGPYFISVATELGVREK